MRLHLAAISHAPLLRRWLVSLQLGVVADKVGSEAQVVLVIYRVKLFLRTSWLQKCNRGQMHAVAAGNKRSMWNSQPAVAQCCCRWPFLSATKA